MAMRYVRPETMIMISNQWLTEMRILLEALPLTAPLVPLIERIHADLLAKQSLRSALEAQLAVLQERMTLLDLLHDRKMRGTHLILSGLAEAANDPAAAALLLTLRDHLFPEGLLAVNRSYVEQAGDAHRLPARLTPAQELLLAALATPDGTLDQYVEQWRTAALELAEPRGRARHPARAACPRRGRDHARASPRGDPAVDARRPDAREQPVARRDRHRRRARAHPRAPAARRAPGSSPPQPRRRPGRRAARRRRPAPDRSHPRRRRQPRPAVCVTRAAPAQPCGAALQAIAAPAQPVPSDGAR